MFVSSQPVFSGVLFHARRLVGKGNGTELHSFAPPRLRSSLEGLMRSQLECLRGQDEYPKAGTSNDLGLACRTRYILQGQDEHPL